MRSLKFSKAKSNIETFNRLMVSEGDISVILIRTGNYFRQIKASAHRTETVRSGRTSPWVDPGEKNLKVPSRDKRITCDGV
ncbi:hypothetical protein RUM44_010361 [Polyplax serrata]|uniref:Uncharacterized protein n=1 Tax=Polyplax serrata TaxID=468196 RepID=A0ABR1AVC7_POLSC